MTLPAAGVDEVRARTFPFPAKHFLSVNDLDPPQVADLLELADGFVAFNRQKNKKLDLLKGRTHSVLALLKDSSSSPEFATALPLLPKGHWPQVLRHRSQNTTGIYAKVSLDALRGVARPWPIVGAGR